MSRAGVIIAPRISPAPRKSMAIMPDSSLAQTREVACTSFSIQQANAAETAAVPERNLSLLISHFSGE